MSDETIEEKTIRFGLLAEGSAPCKSQIKRLVIQRAGTRSFILECKLVELAIAEERETLMKEIDRRYVKY